MDETKVQIGNDVLFDIGTHSDWYISTICYDNESVNIELRRKADRNNKWWVAEQTESDSEIPNNCEPQTIRCPKCGRSDYIREFGKDFSVTAEKAGFKYKCINCNTYIKDEATISKMEQVGELQTKDYCDICNHKGCEYCISDGRNPYCVPSNYEPKDELKTERPWGMYIVEHPMYE